MPSSCQTLPWPINELSWSGNQRPGDNRQLWHFREGGITGETGATVKCHSEERYQVWRHPLLHVWFCSICGTSHWVEWKQRVSWDFGGGGISSSPELCSCRTSPEGNLSIKFTAAGAIVHSSKSVPYATLPQQEEVTLDPSLSLSMRPCACKMAIVIRSNVIRPPQCRLQDCVARQS